MTQEGRATESVAPQAQRCVACLPTPNPVRAAPVLSNQEDAKGREKDATDEDEG